MDALVVDDEPGPRGHLEEVLSLTGYRVDTAADGAEALERLAARRYDLVVTDYDMPRVDGGELVRRMQHAYRETPVLLTTGRGPAERDALAKELAGEQFLGVLGKPSTVRELLEAIRG